MWGEGMQKREKTERTVSIRNTIGVMAAIMLAVSALLLAATHSTEAGYADLTANTRRYAQWQLDAGSLQSGSDILTEQVRGFVVTGERAYLDSYFEEANVTRSRDRAVESMRSLVGESEAYQHLVDALGESVELMDREYYAMRLTVDACGYELSAFPAEIRAVELSAADREAPGEVQRETARMMVFDDIYRGKKEAISGSIRECLDEMDAEVEAGQTAAREKMQCTLMLQRVMIVVSILSVAAAFLLIMLLAVKPLLDAVTYVEKDQPLPSEGAREFRFMAKAYNVMHQMNLEQKRELAYEANHDKLTGVYNRNGYDSILRSVDWENSALVLFDLDQFKPVNDTYGHKMGDRVLQRAAGAIQNAFRGQDYVCRIGGDEFAVIMVRVNIDSAQRIAEKVDRINAELRQPKEDIPGIHISCGVAYGALIHDIDKLFHDADAALYRVKRNGGGGCEVCM